MFAFHPLSEAMSNQLILQVNRVYNAQPHVCWPRRTGISPHPRQRIRNPGGSTGIGHRDRRESSSRGKEVIGDLLVMLHFSRSL